MPTVNVYNTSGKKTGKLSLPKEIFGQEPNEKLIAQAVRVYLANNRQGGAKTKTRGQRRGSTRKIYRQKGTGRARHGSIRAPIFVKGGRAHGPTGTENFNLRLAKKMRRQALFSALSSKLKEKRIKVITGLEKIKPKTKEMARVLENFKLKAGEEKISLVIAENLEDIRRSASNIQKFSLLQAKQLNAYKVLNNQWLLFAKSSIKVVKDTFLPSGLKT